jgi:hypothetical protein
MICRINYKKIEYIPFASNVVPYDLIMKVKMSLSTSSMCIGETDYSSALSEPQHWVDVSG